MSTHLCHLATDWRGEVPRGGAMVEEKIDGWRALWFPGLDDGWRLWTRQGHPIGGIEHIAHRLMLMMEAAGELLMFDGELQVDGSLAATKEWCERGWKRGGTAGVLHLFDCVPLADWRAGACPIPLYERKARLTALLDATADEWDWRAGSHGADEADAVRIVADEWCFDDADVIRTARRIWAAGGEGVMVKDAEASYQRKRSAAWQKVKQGNAAKWQRAPIAA